MKYCFSRRVLAVVGAVGLGLAPLALADDTKAPVPGSDAVSPDNSKMNQRDNGSVAPTAEQQGNAQGDVETTRKIRSAINDDKNLSTDAHNVKIITRGGHVLLKGPVHSQEEKRSVEATAAKAAGKAQVKSELEVAQ